MIDADASLELDPLEFAGQPWQGTADRPGGSVERHFIAGMSRPIELALDYAHAGLFDEATDLLRALPRTDPMVVYYAAWFRDLAGDEPGARTILAETADLSPDFFFPNQVECVPSLESALRLNPSDWKAAYGLGNFWYAHRCPDEAIACWERCRAINPEFPTAIRNLGLAYVNKRHDTDQGLEAYKTAFALDPSDARIFFELDQLHKFRNATPQERLERLESHPELVELRDDLTIERVTLLNALGRHAEALAILLGRTFHPWEGGEGKPTGQYVQALIGLARGQIAAGRPLEAVATLTRARTYPDNLGEGKLPGARESHVLYWLGYAHSSLSDTASAGAAWRAASAGQADPGAALYYNDQPPEMIFYQGLALGALGRQDEASRRFETLVNFGRDTLGRPATIDYFAVSLPDFLVFDDDLGRRNTTHGHYLNALGHLGLGRFEEAVREFDRTLELDRNHFGALIHRPLAAAPRG